MRMFGRDRARLWPTLSGRSSAAGSRQCGIRSLDQSPGLCAHSGSVLARGRIPCLLPAIAERPATITQHPLPSAIPRRARYLGIDPGRRVSVRHPRGVSVLGDGAEATDFGSCTNTQTSAIALVNILTTAGASASVRRGGDSPDWHRTESNGLPWSAPCLGFLVAGVTLVDNCARGRWSVR